MDDIIAKIKEYVLVLNEDIDNDDFLDFIVNEVVDRALVYMNRDGLVYQYEQDLTDFPNTDSTWGEFWANYKNYPIPPRLERPLAGVVVSVYKTAQSRNEGQKDIASMSDNGQSISYRETITNYLHSSDDASIFAGVADLLSRYRLAKVLGGTKYANDKRL